jgi:transcriptional regulator with GAF, ATPase, and Fis domain
VKFPLLDERGVPYALCGIATNINRLKQAEAKLEESLLFEKLITGLSAKFINIPTNKIDRAIEEGLRTISESLDVQRSNFFQVSDCGKQLTITHSYEAQGVKKALPRIGLEKKQPWLGKMLLSGKKLRFSRIDELPAEAGSEREFLLREGVKSVLIIPLVLEERTVGAISFATMEREQEWPDGLIEQLRLLCEIFTNALARKQADQELNNAFSEINQLKDRYEAESILLREEIKHHHGHEEIVGNSDLMKEALYRVRQVASSDSTVLLLGETGTGKELLAQEIHSLSTRKDRPMVTVNCAALPPTLIETELFGREKGAYTGALTKQVGRFEIADGGTIFLDEIGDLPTDLQTKLLRVIQEGQFERLGSTKTINANVRVIAATNREIEKLVEEGRFREDLYYRLNVFPITAPPLRDRPGDIPLLTWCFVRELGERMGKAVERINKKDLEALAGYHWPGNVRELRNVIERAMILCKDSTLNIPVPKAKGVKADEGAQVKTIREVEKQHILRTLERTRGKVSGKGGAAEILGLKPTTLRSRMEKLGIKNRKGNYDIS